jgi:quercetin dioxygenase-like cupin family protein
VALGGRPYTDSSVKGNSFIRTFENTITQEDCEWHRDSADRTVRVIEGKGWKFQKDGTLPFTIGPGSVINIKKEQYHRIIPGDTNLVVEIVENGK